MNMIELAEEYLVDPNCTIATIDDIISLTLVVIARDQADPFTIVNSMNYDYYRI